MFEMQVRNRFGVEGFIPSIYCIIIETDQEALNEVTSLRKLFYEATKNECFAILRNGLNIFLAVLEAIDSIEMGIPKDCRSQFRTFQLNLNDFLCKLFPNGQIFCTFSGPGKFESSQIEKLYNLSMKIKRFIADENTNVEEIKHAGTHNLLSVEELERLFQILTALKVKLNMIFF